jgi:hypothetical protein
VRRADSLGDKALGRVDETFPAIRKPTGELYADAKSIVFFPLNKGLDTYGQERKKLGGGDGVITYSKALVSTAFVLSAETLAWVGGFLAAKKQEVSEKAKN